MTEPKELEYPNFTNFVLNFKKMLVCRYNWNVDDASKFDTSLLEHYYNSGQDIYEAYFDFFDVENDLQDN